MRAGKLRNRVTIQTQTTAQNAIGEPAVTWAGTAQRWASLEPLSVEERVIAHQVTPVATHKMKFRYDSTIVENTRITFGSRTFYVTASSDPDTKTHELDVLVREEK